MNRAAGLALAGDALLCTMDTLIKALAARYPTFEIAFLRFGFGTLWASAVFAWYAPGLPSRETVKAHSLRSVLVVVTATSFFYALSVLPLAETIALSFISPLLTAVFGSFILKERIDGRIGLGLALGFGGMILMVGQRLGAGDYQPGAVYGIAAVLISATCYALSIVQLRVRATRDPFSTIVLFQNAGPALLLAVPAAYVWQTPSLVDIGLFAIVGALGVSGHIMLAKAFAAAEAARLAPLHYSTLVWGSIFGIAFFGEVPGVATLSGGVLIIAATIVTQRR